MYERAQSPVGASGLMQLMPATAAHTAQKLGETPPSPNALTNAEINVRLGSAYIKGLLDQYDGNRVLAAAAYNAGPGRVRNGLVPRITETQAYVDNVLLNWSRLSGINRPVTVVPRVRGAPASADQRAFGRTAAVSTF